MTGPHPVGVLTVARAVCRSLHGHLDVKAATGGLEGHRRVRPQLLPTELVPRRSLVVRVSVDRLSLEQPDQVLVARDRLQDIER